MTKQKKSHARKALTQRAYMISALLGYAAEKENGVFEFRKVLPGQKLLAQDSLEAWVNQQHKNDQLTCGNTRTVNLLRYPDAMNKENLVRTIRGGVLDELCKLSKILAAGYGWQEAEAVLFILTGLKPYLSPVQCSFSPYRILLAVDPFVYPDELADYYRVARRRYNSNNKRPRARTEKFYMLGQFIARFGEDMEAWNSWCRSLNPAESEKVHPWEFFDLQQFQSACREVQADVQRHIVGDLSRLFPPKKSPRREKLIGQAEACKLLNISKATFYRRIKAGKIPKPIKRNGSPQWIRNEIESVNVAPVVGGTRLGVPQNGF